MTLDDIEKLIAAASPAPWPTEFGRCDFPDQGAMACGPIIAYDRDAEEDAEEHQAQADQDFICMSRELMPKLFKVVAAAKLWLISADIYSQHRLSSDRTVYKVDYMQGREIFRKALAELEQP
ncbi:MAG: hypothetical protein MUP44_09950 [Anaerolineales bacterium]|nr:hypothetical protein [Anaerolineales bacterium]